MKRIQGVFVTGLLVLVPLIATVYILMWFVNLLERGARAFFLTTLIPFDFRGLGFLLSIGLIFVAGLLAQNYVGTIFLRLFDTVVKRIPVGGGIYSGIKKFLGTVVNPSSDKFKGVVLVEFPRKGIYTIGFRTGTPDPKLSKDLPRPMVNVFIPCTPNPTSGFYLLVDEAETVAVDMSVQEAFKVVISMGIVTTEEKV